MNKYLLAVLLILFIIPVNTSFVSRISLATLTYYFSSSTGNDLTGDGTQALPWRTIDKANAMFPTLSHGDRMLFMKGDTWKGANFETLVLTASGVANDPIIISSYGTGAKPVFSGMVDLVFTLSTASKYVSQNLSFAGINMLSRDGIPKAIARYPNPDAAVGSGITAGGYIKLTSHYYNSSQDTGTLTATAIAAVPDYLDGTNVVQRKENWVIDSDTIMHHTNGSNTFTFKALTNSNYTPNDGYGFFLQSDEAFLDQNGEWWQTKGASKRITYFSNTGMPTGVSAAITDNLVTCDDESFVTIDGIDFQGCDGDMILLTSSSSTDIVIQNCTLNQAGHDAVFTVSDNTAVLNCIISNSLDGGVLSNGDRTIVKNCTITNTGILPGMGGSEFSYFGYIGIDLKGDHAIIENNSVVNTGGTGIGVHKSGDYDSIIGNRVDYFGLLKKDLGGIYFFGKGNLFPSEGHVCDNNVVSNGVGGVNGSSNSNIDVYCFYLDEESAGIRLQGNSGFNAARGFQANPGCSSDSILNNKFWNNSYNQAYFSMGDTLTAANDPASFGLVKSLGPILTAGSGYANGTYTGKELHSAITGVGMLANIVVSGGKVTSVSLGKGITGTKAGSGFTVGEKLTVLASDVGGSGSGFSIGVGTIYPGNIVKHNIYFSTTATQQTGAYFSGSPRGSTGGRNYSTFGVMDSNLFYRPISPATTIYRDPPTAGQSTSITNMSLATFQGLQSTLESNSESVFPVGFSSAAEQSVTMLFLANSSNSPSTISLSGTYNDIRTEGDYVGEVIVPPHSSMILRKTAEASDVGGAGIGISGWTWNIITN